MKCKCYGLSIVEVLIVIAVIAILGAVLFPFFGKVQETARQAGCASNLREIGIACLQYTHDNDNNMPQSWMGAGGLLWESQANRTTLRVPRTERGNVFESEWTYPNL
jgi:prepilin-type N-terminal cleavage/methylation domain-containing protein